ncbi:MAG TPA: hypothetical protein VEA69_05225 [Tepidisphaeraceae bacterium]|nr:hypothetical protein [Tepidisphaeraceae bacterium]
MRLLHGTIFALLTFALAGGAQVCMAVCAKPHQTRAVPVQAEQACGKCHSKPAPPQTPAAPTPAEPCHHCKAGPSDRLADRIDTAVAPLLATSLSIPSIVTDVPAFTPAARPTASPAPPNDILHVVCVLLI